MNPAVLVMDMQPRFLQYVPEYDKLVINQKKVLRFCAQKDIPAILVEFVNSYDPFSPTLSELVYEWKKVPRRSKLTKKVPNAFSNPHLNKRLKQWEISDLLGMGVYASQCVWSSMVCGYYEKGFRVFTSPDLMGDQGGLAKEYGKIWKETCALYEGKGWLLKDSSEALGRLEEMMK